MQESYRSMHSSNINVKYAYSMNCLFSTKTTLLFMHLWCIKISRKGLCLSSAWRECFSCVLVSWWYNYDKQKTKKLPFQKFLFIFELVGKQLIGVIDKHYEYFMHFLHKPSNLEQLKVTHYYNKDWTTHSGEHERGLSKCRSIKN